MVSRLLKKFLLILILGIFALPQLVYAFPPLPSSFYGTVTKNGTYLPEGVTIMAVINNKVYAGNTVKIYDGESVYSLVIPGDDPATDAIEGGVQGDTIYFNVGGVLADQIATWQSGSNTNLDITVSSDIIEPTYVPTATPTNKPTTSSTRTNTPIPTRTQTSLVPTQAPTAIADTSTPQLTSEITQTLTDQVLTTTPTLEASLTEMSLADASQTLESGPQDQINLQETNEDTQIPGMLDPAEKETTDPSGRAQQEKPSIGLYFGIAAILLIIFVSGFLYFRKNDSSNDSLL